MDGHEAQRKLGQVIGQAQPGAQVITVRGRPTPVVISVAGHQRLAGSPALLVGFFRASPLHGVELDLTRRADTIRVGES